MNADPVALFVLAMFIGGIWTLGIFLFGVSVGENRRAAIGEKE